MRDADFLVSGRVKGLFSEVNLFSDWLAERWRVNSGTSDTNLFTEGLLLMTGRVNGSTGDTNFLTEGRVWTGRVDSGTTDTNFFAETWLISGRVYGSTADSDLLTIAGLDTGSIFTFSDVDISACVLSALRTSRFDVNVVCGLVFASRIRNLEVDVGR